MLTTGRRATSPTRVGTPTAKPSHSPGLAATRSAGFNIFVMDIAKRASHPTHQGEGPAMKIPGGRPTACIWCIHLETGQSTQIYTMLADGTNVQQITTQGNNLQPVWAKGLD